MIKVYYKKIDGNITEIELNGHACFDDYGKDIVCAGVSSVVITSVNAILSFDEEAITYSGTNPLKVVNIKKDEITNKLLDNLLDMLLEIERKYQKNIIVKEKSHE